MINAYASPVTDANICAILSEASHIYDREFLEWYAARPDVYFFIRVEGAADDCAIVSRSTLEKTYVIRDSDTAFLTLLKKT